MNIAVDGGIGLENIELVASAGANMIVAGSSVFNSPSPAYVISSLKR